jgi:hypothetical protein
MHHILKTKNGKCRLEKVKKILECRKGNGKEEPEELKARRIGEIRMCVESEFGHWQRKLSKTTPLQKK